MSVLLDLPPSLRLPHATDDRGPGALLTQRGGAAVALPLDSVRVRSHIVGFCAHTVVTQRFRNDHDKPLEATYLFPLPDRGAVTRMVLTAGEVVVEAECKERQEAKKTFQDARAKGHRAAMLEADRADVHTLTVTNLPPKSEVIVEIEVVEQLDAVDGWVCWRFPTVIPPRYLPGNATGHDGKGVLPNTDQVPDASRLQPPLRLSGGTRLDLEVTIDGPVQGVRSSLHAVQMSLDGGAVRVAPSGKATLNKDFAISFSTGQADAPAARAFTDGRSTLVMVEPPTVAMPATLARDAVFVVDISGSMSGTKMTAAKTALMTALHGLDVSDRFRLIAFDDQIEAFNPGFCTVDDTTLAAADRWIDGLYARGGTEMLPAIQEALRTDGAWEGGRLRTVLFITDGQAWNHNELLAAVHHRRREARFFTLGIDTAVNSALLGDLARVGGGTMTLCTPQDDIEEVVANLEARFGSPLLRDVTAEGVTAQAMATGDDQATDVFAGQPATLLFKGAPAELIINATGPNGAWRVPCAVQRVNAPITTLWAREQIGALERKMATRPDLAEGLRGAVLALALEHHLASRFTAFIAVERSLTLGGERIEIVQPVELPESWSESFRASPPPMQPSPMAGALPPPSPVRRRSMSAAAPTPKRARKSVFEKAKSMIVDSFSMMDEAEVVKEPMPAYETQTGSFSMPSEGASNRPGRVRVDPAATLAQTQSANGSFGSDLQRTLAAVLTLILLGSTRRTGPRRRVVAKAAAWLEQHRGAGLVDQVLAYLEQVEASGSATPPAFYQQLTGAAPEGQFLHEAAM